MPKVKKKCLFCKETLKPYLVHDTCGQGVALRCPNCGARGPVKLNLGEAIAFYKPFKKNKDTLPLEITSEAHRLSEELLIAILKSVPKIKAPNLKLWARDIDMMFTVDRRDVELVREVIVWLPTARESNGFCWNKVILSASSFRKNFDKLLGAKGMTSRKEVKGTWDTTKTKDYGETKGF